MEAFEATLCLFSFDESAKPRDAVSRARDEKYTFSWAVWTGRDKKSMPSLRQFDVVYFFHTDHVIFSKELLFYPLQNIHSYTRDYLKLWQQLRPSE